MKMYWKKKKFAKELRKGQTDYEEIVWQQLRSRQFLGFKFRRQHVVEGFVVDFYCHELGLAIELDGKIHEKQKEYDAERDAVINSKALLSYELGTEKLIRMSKLFMKKYINIWIK